MRRLLLLLPLVFANLGQAPAVKGGTVTGTVKAVVKGKEIKLDDLYVYLERDGESLTVGKGVVAVIGQKDEKFDPKITVIPRGAEIRFPNQEKSTEHNVFSPGVKTSNWDTFDLGRYGPDKNGKRKPFHAAGEFDIYCDVHKDMWAKVKVVPTRYFARVKDGKFVLEDIPPGAYKLIAWAPGNNEYRSGLITVAANATVEAKPMNLQYHGFSTAHSKFDGSPYVDY